MSDKIVTWVHKVKCLNCSLHFAAYSFKQNWVPDYCPECGTQLQMTGVLHWVEGSNEEIFRHVPGDAKFSEQGGVLPEQTNT